jgi:hemolysin III
MTAHQAPRPSKPRRAYSRSEHIGDSAVHVLGVGFGLGAVAWLLFHVSGAAVIASVSVYCAGLLAMLSASALYNMTPQGPSKEILRRLDHAAIFIMIAATYTPFAVNRLGAPTGPLILSAIWVTAGLGIFLKLVFPRRFEMFSVALYLAMGWLSVSVLKPLASNVAEVNFWLLVAGGLVYSAGVVFYLMERLPFHKAIWHCFVLSAAVLHFTAIAMEFTT